MRFDARAREWVTRELGPGHRVLDARRARGGVASVVHRVRVADRAGHVRCYMVRRVPFRDDVRDHDPEGEVRNEAHALQLAGGGPIPELVAVDPTGAACGAAALVSTWLPGRPDVAPRDPDSWVRELARAIDAVPVSAGPDPAFPPFAPWYDLDGRPPEWSRAPEAWEHVRARLDAGPPAGGEPRFLHRDFHPGNVLLHRGRFSGIVDWTQAAVGPREVDVSRARVEIAILGDLHAADAFLRSATDPAGYDPLWDALVACELGPWSYELLELNHIGARLTLPGVRATLDTLVEAAARHL